MMNNQGKLLHPFTLLALLMCVSLIACEDTAPPHSSELLWDPGPRGLSGGVAPNPAGLSAGGEGGNLWVSGTEAGTEAGTESGTESGTPAPTALPRVVIESPPRALYTAESTWSVEGYVDDPRMLTNGVSVDDRELALGEGLTFTHELSLPHGPHIIESKAMIDGRMIAADYRTIVSGLHMPEEAPAYESVAFQLSTSALNEIASRIDGFVSPESFNAILTNPVLNEGVNACFGFGFGFCDFGVRVNAYNPRFSEVFATVTPQEGQLVVSFTMTEFIMDWDGEAIVSAARYGGEGVMYAEAIRVDMALGLDWSPEQGRWVRVIGTEVSSSGVVYDFNDFFYQAMSSLGLPLDQMMTSMMESTFEDLLVSQVPQQMFEMITEDAAIFAEVPVADEEVTLTGEVSRIAINDQGLKMWYDLFATPSVRLHPEYETRWFGDFEGVTLGDSQRALALFGLEGMNNVLHAVWQAGGLDFTLPGERLGLTPEVMDQLIPDVGPVEIHVTGLLPPLLTHNEGSDVPWITMGDVIMKVSAQGEGADASLITVVTSIKGLLNMQTNGLSLTPELLEPEVFPTITQPTEVNPLLALGLPTLLIPLVQEQLPLILAERVVFPVDLIRSYRLDDISAEALDGLGYLLTGWIVER